VGAEPFDERRTIRTERRVSAERQASYECAGDKTGGALGRSVVF
jgi:hypothetical protein